MDGLDFLIEERDKLETRIGDYLRQIKDLRARLEIIKAAISVLGSTPEDTIKPKMDEAEVQREVIAVLGNGPLTIREIQHQLDARGIIYTKAGLSTIIKSNPQLSSTGRKGGAAGATSYRIAD